MCYIVAHYPRRRDSFRPITSRGYKTNYDYVEEYSPLIPYYPLYWAWPVEYEPDFGPLVPLDSHFGFRQLLNPVWTRIQTELLVGSAHLFLYVVLLPCI